MGLVLSGIQVTISELKSRIQVIVKFNEIKDLAHYPINGRNFDEQQMQDIFYQVKNAAYQIITSKGHTNWAIGLVIASIIRSIKEDQRRILPVSVRLNGEYDIDHVCLSLPAVVGLHGVENFILPALNKQELQDLKLSVQTLLEPLQALNLE